MRILGYFLWAAVACGAAIGLGTIALQRGEHINSLWLVVAAAGAWHHAQRAVARCPIHQKRKLGA